MRKRTGPPRCGPADACPCTDVVAASRRTIQALHAGHGRMRESKNCDGGAGLLATRRPRAAPENAAELEIPGSCQGFLPPRRVFNEGELWSRSNEGEKLVGFDPLGQWAAAA